MGEDRGRGETLLEFLEGQLLGFLPAESYILPCELREWLNGGREAADESPVVSRRGSPSLATSLAPAPTAYTTTVAGPPGGHGG